MCCSPRARPLGDGKAQNGLAPGAHRLDEASQLLLAVRMRRIFRYDSNAYNIVAGVHAQTALRTAFVGTPFDIPLRRLKASADPNLLVASILVHMRIKRQLPIVVYSQSAEGLIHAYDGRSGPDRTFTCSG